MADQDKEFVSRDDAVQAVLTELIKATENRRTGEVKDLAIAYRLLTGGPQPGSSIVESK